MGRLVQADTRAALKQCDASETVTCAKAALARLLLAERQSGGDSEEATAFLAPPPPRALEGTRRYVALRRR